jgi:hypothetical protein
MLYKADLKLSFSGSSPGLLLASDYDFTSTTFSTLVSTFQAGPGFSYSGRVLHGLRLASIFYLGGGTADFTGQHAKYP